MCIIATALIAALAGAPSFAADQPLIQEIIVTAQKHEQSVQDAGLSVSVLTGGDLELKGLESFRDWATYVPGLTMYQGLGANRRAGPTAVVRGVSQTAIGGLNEVSSQATTSYTLGQVPMFSGDPGLFDINRIEVLRGPQGTLFGTGSMGGTIRFIPNEARTDQVLAEVGVGGGSIHDGGNTYDLDLMANMPIIEDVLAVRLSIASRHSDGFIDMYTLPLDLNDPALIRVNGWEFDSRPGDKDGVIKDMNSTDTTGGRLSLTYTPNDRFALRAFSMWQKSDQRMKQAIDYNDQSEDWVVSRFALEPQYDEFNVTSLELSYDLGFGSLEYVGGRFENKISETVDSTTGVTSYLNGTGANAGVHVLDMDGPGGLPRDPWPSPTPLPFDTESYLLSHELRLQGQDKPLGVSLFGSELRFDYVVGVFHLKEERYGAFHVSNPTWNVNRGSNTFPVLTEGGVMLSREGGADYENESVFADITLHLTEKLAIGGGARYSDNRRVSEEYGYGDFYAGTRATNGATEGDDLTEKGVPVNVGTIEDDGITPRYTASYRFDDRRLLYLTAAKGQRMPSSFAQPNFDFRSAECRALAEELAIADDALNGAKTDTVWSYDLGIKSMWLDRRLLLNASIYHLDWSDLQRTVQMSQINPACNLSIPANVSEVEVEGFELEMVYAPVDSLSVNAAIAYTDAQIAETVPGVNDSLGQRLEKGDAIEHVAPWTVAAGVQYQFSVPFMNRFMDREYTGYARVDWRYAAERMGNNIGDEASLRADPIRSQFISDSYSLTDLRFGVDSNDWSASLYVSNLFNKRAIFESFRDATRPNLRTTSVSRPRTVGFTIKKRF